ncbi:MAG TPA: MIP/aquaporin family protein [Gammaproteobacteria bacterium]|nr:MIP/aquaporin family protein [Gammaproteobacteria bacterium]
MTEYFGEFFGTLMLIVLGNGVVAGVLLQQSKAYAGGWITITTGWFVAVVIGVFVAQSAGSPNADINPAISLAKYFLNVYPIDKMLYFMIAQLAGAFVGAVLVWLSYLPHWKVTENSAHKLMIFSTVPAIRSYPSNFLCEVIATIVLVIGVAAIFGKATPSGPVSGLGAYLVGVLVWGIGLSLGGPTGYAINPARDLGPRIAHAVLPISGKGSSDWSYALVPILAPLLGAFIAALLWREIFY